MSTGMHRRATDARMEMVRNFDSLMPSDVVAATHARVLLDEIEHMGPGFDGSDIAAMIEYAITAAYKAGRDIERKRIRERVLGGLGL
jgi:hypothetical protein